MVEEMFLPHIERARREAMKVVDPRERLKTFYENSRNGRNISLKTPDEMEMSEVQSWLNHFFIAAQTRKKFVRRIQHVEKENRKAKIKPCGKEGGILLYFNRKFQKNKTRGRQ